MLASIASGENSLVVREYSQTTTGALPLSVPRSHLPEAQEYGEFKMQNMMTAHFLQEFDGEYLRNNKSNGMKNLRCFPVCSPNEHNQCGFCGSGVLVRIKFKEG